MELKFTTEEGKIAITIEDDLTTIEVWNVDRWNVVCLDKAQLEELKKFLKIN